MSPEQHDHSATEPRSRKRETWRLFRVSLREPVDKEKQRESRRRSGVLVVLLLIALFGYSLAYTSTYQILLDLQHNRFGPADAGEIIYAISGLAVAIGVSIFLIVKACAFYLHAHADVLRAESDISARGEIDKALSRAMAEPGSTPKSIRNSGRHKIDLSVLVLMVGRADTWK